MLAHLQQEGYGKSVLALEAESGVLLSKYEVCDNVDLATVIQEYEAYYAIKFGRAPKLIRKVQTHYCLLNCLLSRSTFILCVLISIFPAQRISPFAHLFSVVRAPLPVHIVYIQVTSVADERKAKSTKTVSLPRIQSSVAPPAAGAVVDKSEGYVKK